MRAPPGGRRLPASWYGSPRNTAVLPAPPPVPAKTSSQIETKQITGFFKNNILDGKDFFEPERISKDWRERWITEKEATKRKYLFKNEEWSSSRNCSLKQVVYKKTLRMIAFYYFFTYSNSYSEFYNNLLMWLNKFIAIINIQLFLL